MEVHTPYAGSCKTVHFASPHPAFAPSGGGKGKEEHSLLFGAEKVSGEVNITVRCRKVEIGGARKEKKRC